MIASFSWSHVADWLATFALHSTCALGGAWLLSVALRRRAVVLQERALRFALWAALVSTTVQITMLGSPLGLSLPNDVPVADELVEAAGVPFEIVDMSVDPMPEPARAVWTLPRMAWSTWFVGVAVTMALFGGVWLLRVHSRLRQVLRDRHPETDARVLAAAASVASDLGLRQSPRLSRSELLATPIAFGWLRPEVCLPLRAGELGDESLRAMLAHEVAHLRRGDPAWMWVAAGLQAMFPWQVLLLAVRRRWVRLVELRCDAIAAQHSSPTAVARCLLDVAEWLRPMSTVPLGALGMAARPSALRERIEAALRPRSMGRSRPLLSVLLGGVSLTSLSLAAPGVQRSETTSNLAPPAFVVPEESFAVDDAAAAAPAHASARESFAALEQEHRALTAEVAAMQAELRTHRLSPELGQLVSTLSRRLLAVERLRTRLQAKLDRRDPTEVR